MAASAGSVMARCAAWLVVIALTLAGCSSSGPHAAPGSEPAELARYYTQTLAWSSCEQFECASLTVPVDYTEPGGRTIQVAVIRARATDPAHRIGSLITNPGGPGGSGVDYIKQSYPARPGQPSHFGPQLRANFDIVGFDPRGVGDSAPIACLSDSQLDNYLTLDPTPDNPGEVNAVVAGNQNFGVGCQAHSATLLPYVGTPNAARDMDILRAALGDEKMYYLGASYGTYLGAIYTELFPARIARAVLDGAVPPSLSSEELGIGQARGFQTELTRFIADCITHPDCPLGTDATTAEQKLADFFASADIRPVPTGTSRMLNESLARTGVVVTMYGSPQTWPILQRALGMAMAGDGRGLLALSDLYYDRDPKTGNYSNQSAANAAVNCLDYPNPVQSVQDVRAGLPAYEQASPLVGASFAWSALTCASWPVPAKSQPHPVHYAGSPPFLVVGTVHDPATPYQFAQQMTQQLGSAVLLTYHGDGHTAYGRGSSCINAAVDAYLIQGSVPPKGTVCLPDSGLPR